MRDANNLPKRILILAATAGYQTRILENTARRIGLEPVMATDRCHMLEDPWGDSALAVRFEDPEAGARMLACLQPPPDGIVAVGDRPTEIAALTAALLGLPWHSRSAVLNCRNKFLSREKLRIAGLPVPSYFCVPANSTPAEAVQDAAFPCVLKPLGLSGSRGVIRADNPSQFIEAFCRIQSILNQPDIRQVREIHLDFIQIESYIHGQEFALEGLVIGGKLRTLAIFDKPDPLEGPFFEETIYVTPSSAPASVQGLIEAATQSAVEALGLTNGPIHSEMRVNDSGVYILEVAARPIGGLCAQSLRFNGDTALEEVIMRFAVGEDIRFFDREQQASGVMMIPIPSSGVFRGVKGIEDAVAVPGVTDVQITAVRGQRLLRLPEGASYAGFIFARAGTSGQVQTALKDALSQLRFEIMPELAALRPKP